MILHLLLVLEMSVRGSLVVLSTRHVLDTNFIFEEVKGDKTEQAKKKETIQVGTRAGEP